MYVIHYRLLNKLLNKHSFRKMNLLKKISKFYQDFKSMIKSLICKKIFVLACLMFTFSAPVWHWLQISVLLLFVVLSNYCTQGLSHFDFMKEKMFRSLKVGGSNSLGVPMTTPEIFSGNQNDSNQVLSEATYAENQSIFDFKKDSLMYLVHLYVP